MRVNLFDSYIVERKNYALQAVEASGVIIRQSLWGGDLSLRAPNCQREAMLDLP